MSVFLQQASPQTREATVSCCCSLVDYTQWRPVRQVIFGLYICWKEGERLSHRKSLGRLLVVTANGSCFCLDVTFRSCNNPAVDLCDALFRCDRKAALITVSQIPSQHRRSFFLRCCRKPFQLSVVWTLIECLGLKLLVTNQGNCRFRKQSDMVRSFLIHTRSG